MARYRYQPYRRRRSSIKRRNIAYFLLSLIVIIGGITLLSKLRNKEEGAGLPPEEDVTLIEVEPTERDIAPEPLPRPEPERMAEPEPETDFARTIIEPGNVSGEAATLIAEAQQAIEAGHTIAARDKLNRMLVSMPLSSEESAAPERTD